MAGDVNGRKCTSGMLFFFGNCLVSWQCQKQKVVSLSSCESEYVAATTAACQGIWLGRFLSDLLETDPLIAGLLVDNNFVIQLCKNPIFHDRSKYIAVRYHYIRGCIEDGMIAIKFIGTDDQLVNIFTKALGRVRLLLLRERINVVEVK